MFLMGEPKKALEMWRGSTKYKHFKPKKITPVPPMGATRVHNA